MRVTGTEIIQGLIFPADTMIQVPDPIANPNPLTNRTGEFRNFGALALAPVLGAFAPAINDACFGNAACQQTKAAQASASQLQAQAALASAQAKAKAEENSKNNTLTITIAIAAVVLAVAGIVAYVLLKKKKA